MPLPPQLTPTSAKPSAALMPYRAMQLARISSSPPKSAEPSMHSTGVIPRSPSAAYIPAKERIEVPLASQEGKKGLVQYAL